MEPVYPLVAACQRPVGQSDERRTRIAEVVGSSPIRSTGIYGSLTITGLVIVIGIQAARVILVMPAAAACLLVGGFISSMPTAAASGGRSDYLPAQAPAAYPAARTVCNAQRQWLETDSSLWWKSLTNPSSSMT